jgi:hypothetical protein
MVGVLFDMQWNDHRSYQQPSNLFSSLYPSPLSVPPPSLPPSPLGLNYLLTYTETGEKKNPQKKLLIVEPQYTTSDIQMRSVQLP